MNKHTFAHRLPVSAWLRRSLARIVFMGIVFAASPLPTLARSTWGPALVVNTESFQIIDDSDTEANIVLRFGDVLNKTLTYNRSAGRFEFNDDLEVTGSLSGSTLTISDLKNCDTIDTDANGNFVCGTDDGGSSGMSQEDGDTRYVNTSGDTMTGGLLIQNGGTAGSIQEGLLLEVSGTASGEHLHFGRMLSGSGTVRFRNVADSTTMFQVLDADGGDPVLNVDTTNERVGIGTASPGQLLHLFKSQNAATNLRIENLGTEVNASSGFDFISPSATAYFFLHGQNRTLSRYGIPSLANWIELTHGSSDSLEGIVLGTRTDKPVVIGSNNTEVVRFTSNGVGIGTTAPETKLEVAGTLSGTALTLGGGAFTLPSADGADGQVMKTDGAGTVTWENDDGGMAQADADARYVNIAGDTMTGALVIDNEGSEPSLNVRGTLSGEILTFGARLSGSGAVKFQNSVDSTTMFQVLDADGGDPVLNVDTTNERVGIGTASPGGYSRDTKLHIKGNGAGTAGRTDFIVENTTADSAASFRLINSAGKSFAAQISGPSYSIGEHASFSTVEAVNLYFGTNGAVSTGGGGDIFFRPGGYSDAQIALTAKSTGLIGIGTTTPETKLEVAGTLSGTALTLGGGAFTLPSADGADGQVMKTDGAGTVTWENDDGGMAQADADARYVNIAGDTMTGALVIDNEGSEPSLNVRGTLSGEILTFGARLSGSGAVKFQNATDSTTMFQVLDADGGDPVLNVDTTNERVGIGTASPGTNLDISGVARINSGTAPAYPTTGAGFEMIYDSDGLAGGTEGGDGVSFFTSYDRNPHGGYTDLWFNGRSLLFNSRSGGDIRFKTDTAGEDFAIIKSTGNFGIGTTTPETKLEVPGIMSGTTVYATKSFSGAGLVDCDNATSSKLLWDATTGRFSCGTDQTGEASADWSNTGSLMGAFDNRYVNQSGDTMTGKLTINLSSGFMGMNILQMLSGSVIHAEKNLTSSGTILSKGNLTTRGTASGKNLTFMGAAGSYILGSLGIGTTTPETKLEVVGTISGSMLKSSGSLSVSGSILTELNTGGGVVYSNTGTLATTVKGSSGQVLVAQGTAAPTFKDPTGSMVWYLDDVIAVGPSQGAMVTMPFGMTVTSVTLRAKGAPTGAALIVDINEGGTTLFSTRPQINASATTGGGGASFSDTALAAGAELTLDIDQIGSTFAGSGLTIQLNGIRKY